MVHEDDKKYLEDLVYYHPDPSALWSGDNVEAGYGIDITLTPATTIAVDTDVVLTRPNLTDYSIGEIIVGNSTIDSDNVDLRAVYSQDVNSFLSLEPTSAILKTVSGTDNSTIGVSGTEVDVTTGMFKYNSSEVATKADLALKQDTLTAGTNVTIDSDNVISAVDTTYTAGNNITIDSDNVISATVKTYTAGTNITIDANDVISATDTTYTAGTNITIDANNVISATNTTYTGVDYVTVDSTNDEIGLDATGKAAVDLVDGHMTESQGSITISDVTMIHGTNYSLDADGYLTNIADGDIKFGTQNTQGTVFSDLYMISGGEGWYLETNNANVSTSVAMDTTVMTQDTAYEFKQDGIYLNNAKITGQQAIQSYNLTFNSTYIDMNTVNDCYIRKQGNLCIISCNFRTINTTPDNAYTNILTSPIKPIIATRFSGGQSKENAYKSARFVLNENGNIDVDFTEITGDAWVTFEIMFFTND